LTRRMISTEIRTMASRTEGEWDADASAEFLKAKSMMTAAQATMGLKSAE